MCIPVYVCTYIMYVCMYLCMLCSMEVILRAEAVEMVQAGDKCDFIGTLIVVPDVAQLRTEGNHTHLVALYVTGYRKI